MADEVIPATGCVDRYTQALWINAGAANESEERVAQAMGATATSAVGPSRHFAGAKQSGRFWREADINWQQRPVDLVENDPEADITHLRQTVSEDGSMLRQRGLGGGMRRREFIMLLGSTTAAAWPLAAPAQQSQKMRRVSVLMPVSEDEPDNRSASAAFVQVMNHLAVASGYEIKIDFNWAKGDPMEIRRLAEQLVALAPDVIVTSGDATMAPLMRLKPKIPVVFNNVTDPVSAGFVESLAQPGGNATGFTRFEYTLAGKWLELLKQIAPHLSRVAVCRDSDTAGGIGQLAVIQSVAPSVGMDVYVINLRDAREIEQGVATFARRPNGGLILTASAPSIAYRELIVALAAQYKLPAVYYRRSFVTGGGLISYGYDLGQQFRDTAGYVDRILKGERPADLPVQAPTKYELVINLTTAKALGITVPPTLLSRADEVIE